MERIIVGVDGSRTARDALRWSADLAHRTGADLIAARVFVSTQAELPPGEADTLRADQRRELESWCAALPEHAPRPKTVLVDGDPPAALLATATERDADLLVVGGRGAGGFAHLHLGSVAHHLTHHTTLPLAIVSSAPTAPVAHLVLGVDGSAGSLAAAEYCAGLAASLGVAVTAVRARESSSPSTPAEAADHWRTHAADDVRRWAASVVAAGVELDVDIDGDHHPVDAIARALDAHPGSAAVVGTRGLGGFVGLRLGRVPLQLVHHTSAPVILVPADGGAAVGR
jgi:nucleotide-binding universal stress UspA family protein